MFALRLQHLPHDGATEACKRLCLLVKNEKMKDCIAFKNNKPQINLILNNHEFRGLAYIQCKDKPSAERMHNYFDKLKIENRQVSCTIGKTILKSNKLKFEQLDEEIEQAKEDYEDDNDFPLLSENTDSSVQDVDNSRCYIAALSQKKTENQNLKKKVTTKTNLPSYQVCATSSKCSYCKYDGTKASIENIQKRLKKLNIDEDISDLKKHYIYSEVNKTDDIKVRCNINCPILKMVNAKRDQKTDLPTLFAQLLKGD